jgi:hypothetical protein
MSRCMWGITTFFNPSASRVRLANYRAFRARSRKQGLPLITVELAMGDAPFELDDASDTDHGGDADILVRKRSSAVLWQKERLLNLALEALPDACTDVCWIDADVLFEDDAWVSECEALLTRFALLQPFDKAIRLPHGASVGDYPSTQLERTIVRGSEDGTYSESVCRKGPSLFGGLDGTTGYAWCARREVLQDLGFYDRCIVGGADVPASATRIRHKPLRMHLGQWHTAFHARVQGRVSHRPGVLHHLWHGDAKQRRYRDRHELLAAHDYDPARDVTVDAQGCLQWATRNDALVAAVREYFASRGDGA